MDTARQLRDAFGRFATGVTIVTASHEGHTYGMTANAFISVSLNPPLVLVSIDRHANMHNLLPVTKRYGISVLAAEQKELSGHFGGRPAKDLEVRFVSHDEVPLVDGALAHFVVHLTDAHPAGDHTLYIGRVEHFHSREGRPLIFHSGRYHQLEGAKALTYES